ncbi:MAG: nicotinate-nucleotide--dimethylbenzimidazole phosphoribosyltransferase [Rhizobiaceae bacterium]
MLEHISIEGLDQALIERVNQKIDMKTKPQGSLGRIEALASQIAAVQNTDQPAVDPAHLLIFAADHGLVEEGVSAWPSEVTTQMVLNFLSGGAAANVFARTNGLDITVVDAGILGDIPNSKGLVKAGIRKGTRNALIEDAMTQDEASQALETGARLAIEKADAGVKALALGEMGIGNTSSASLLAHAIENIPIGRLVGRGAGLDDEGLRHKLEVLNEIATRRPGKLDPVSALCAFGGYEIAMMAGAVIGAASKRVVTVVDGFIATAAALCAIRGRPEAGDYCVFAHRSKEPGHQFMLEALNADPLIDLDLRLGEGTGALLAFPLLRNACAMLNEMATFESAGVSNKDS